MGMGKPRVFALRRRPRVSANENAPCGDEPAPSAGRRLKAGTRRCSKLVVKKLWRRYASRVAHWIAICVLAFVGSFVGAFFAFQRSYARRIVTLESRLAIHEQRLNAKDADIGCLAEAIGIPSYKERLQSQQPSSGKDTVN